MDKDPKVLEASFLSCLFTKAHLVIPLTDIVQVDDFQHRNHAEIYRIISDIARTMPGNEIIDFLVVTQEAEDRSKLRACGGAEYLLTLSDGFAPSDNPVTYASQIALASRKRKIRKVVHKLHSLEGDFSPEEAAESAKDVRLLGDILESSLPTTDTSSIDAIKGEYMSMVTRVYQSGKPIEGIRFGWSPVDKIIGGLSRTDLCVIAGRPGHGKSSVAINILMNNSSSSPKFTGVLFSMEMSRTQIFDRMVSSLTGIQTNLIRHRSPDKSEYEIIKTTSEFISAKDIVIYDRKTLTIGEIRTSIVAKQRKGKVDLVVIDYIQLLTGNKQASRSRNEELGEVSRQLKQAAGDLGVPIIVLAQLNRTNERENKRPRLVDIRESGNIEADADQVILIHNPSYYEAERPDIEDIEFIVAKNRHGATSIVNVQFDRKRATFIPSYEGSRRDDGTGDDPFK